MRGIVYRLSTANPSTFRGEDRCYFACDARDAGSSPARGVNLGSSDGRTLTGRLCRLDFSDRRFRERAFCQIGYPLKEFVLSVVKNAVTSITT